MKGKSSVRAVVQRVRRAEVRVGGERVGSIGFGLLVLVGVGRNDTPESAASLADKVLNLRILDDQQGKMNLSLLQTAGSILCVSQFTLYGDARHGRRPSYVDAALPQAAEPLYQVFLEELRARALPQGIRVESGRFQAMMDVELVNDGPVTILLDTDKVF
jgi:D-aminoacyl-tRNA deacylase